MVSESELIAGLHEFLNESDLSTTTKAIVRRRSEADFGIDLSKKKKFIREQVDLYLQGQFENAEEEDQEHEEDDQTGKIKSEETDSSDSNEEEEEAETEKTRNKRAPAKEGLSSLSNPLRTCRSPCIGEDLGSQANMGLYQEEKFARPS